MRDASKPTAWLALGIEGLRDVPQAPGNPGIRWERIDSQHSDLRISFEVIETYRQLFVKRNIGKIDYPHDELLGGEVYGLEHCHGHVRQDG